MPTLPPRSASLTPFFTPNGVAVIGASRYSDKLSHGLLRNLTDPERGYRGPIYPVNPRATEILGRRCYPDIAAVPDPVELVVSVLPAALTPPIIEACGQRGIKAVIIISGGFREIGPAGAAREQEVVEIGRRYGMRIMGPNGIGVIDTYTPLNTTFVPGMPPTGHIAFISQSGALCGSIIDWTIGNRIGFSRLLSVGNEADVNETDLLPFLAADETSRVIVLYLEDIKGGPAFVPALAAASARKPILALKSGRTASGQVATASHTGALAGVHAGFRAACKQSGVIEVEQVQALFTGALALAYQPLPTNNRIAILTNAGGPAALAADAFEAAGLRLARTHPETQATLRGFLHPDAGVGGPVDMLGGADETHYRRALEALLADPTVDGVLVGLVPQVLIQPAAIVEAVSAVMRGQAQPAKPVLACLMGKASLDAAYAAAHAAELPAYTFPEDAAAAFGILWQRAQWVRQIANCKLQISDRDLALPSHDNFKSTTYTPQSRLLDAYGISTPPEGLAMTADEAVAVAQTVGYPVALKLVSPDILHKTDMGGVILGVGTAEAVQAGFATLITRARTAHPTAQITGVLVQKMISNGQEVIIGVKRDPTFGPLIMFGLGGIYVEALADVSFRLAPLTIEDAHAMIAEVRSARLLDGLRGVPPADRRALAETLVRVGQLAAAHPEIAELDINPLLVLPAGQGVMAVDVRIISADSSG